MTIALRRRAILAAAALPLLPAAARAQADWPNRPVRIIVPFPAGGFVDFTARLIAPPLTTALAQQVVVDNRGGAGGSVGSELAARAAPGRRQASGSCRRPAGRTR